MYQFLHEIDWKVLNNAVQSEKVSSKQKVLVKKALGVNHTRFIETIFPILNCIFPIYDNEIKKYSASKTFAALPDRIETPYYNFSKAELSAYFGFVLHVAPSLWLNKPVGSMPQFSSLTPLVLAAYKEHRGINYEEWDFSDPKMSYMMNKQLYEMISYRDHDFSGVDTLELRGEVTLVRKTGDNQSADRYPTSKKLEIAGIEVKATHPLALMLSQVWCAHASKKHNLSVLDPNDWDRIPEAVDLVAADVESKPNIVDDVPF